MAEEMTGMGMLNKLVEADAHKGCSCFVGVLGASCNDFESCGECNEWVRKRIAVISEKIEREHAEELAAARRERDEALETAKLMERREGFLADEAREAVERLRAISTDWIGTEGIGMAIDPSLNWLDEADSRKLRDRLCELIEHGGKRGADVAALRELADDMDKRAHGAYGKTFVNASMYAGLMHGLSKRIRKAVDGATVPDAESDAERACAALLEWRDQVAGLLGIDGGGMADEVQDAIMAELDKRLMPPGMAWPRFDDGGRVDIGDEFAWAGNAYKCDAVKLGDGFALHCDEAPSSWYGYSFTDHVKRPEPEVLGADGEPIKVGETVWDSTSPNDPTSSTVWRHGGPLKVLRRNDVRAGNVICENDQGIPLDCLAADLTHAAPDTQERIDEDASVLPRRYYADKIGHDVGLKDDEEVFTAVALDLLRRQRELDAKTMGGE